MEELVLITKSFIRIKSGQKNDITLHLNYKKSYHITISGSPVFAINK